MTSTSRKVLLLDVCHTLYSSNTTFDFLAWYLPNDVELGALLKRRQSIFNRVAARLGFKDNIREQAIKCLTGIKRADLDAAAKEFVATLTPIQEVMDKLNEFRTQGYKPVLLSSSLDFLVAAIAELLDIKTMHATTLGYRDSECLGTITADLLNTKANIVVADYASFDTIFITDNHTDLPCAQEVKRFIAVYHNEDSRSAAFWRRNGIRNTLTYV